MIFVGLGAIAGGDEFVARDAQHGIEHKRVGDAAGDELGVDHVAADLGLGVAGHSWFSLLRVYRKFAGAFG
jgi:hypothetical protein